MKLCDFKKAAWEAQTPEHAPLATRLVIWGSTAVVGLHVSWVPLYSAFPPVLPLPHEGFTDPPSHMLVHCR